MVRLWYCMNRLYSRERPMNSSKHMILLARHKIFFYVNTVWILVFSIILPPPYSSSSGVIWGERNEPLNARVLGISLFLNSFLLCFLFSEITNSKGKHHADFYLDSNQLHWNTLVQCQTPHCLRRGRHWKTISSSTSRTTIIVLSPALFLKKPSCFQNPLLSFNTVLFLV